MLKNPKVVAQNKKIYCVFNCGEREDEVELGIQTAEPYLTMNGRHESFETGRMLYKQLRQLGISSMKTKYFCGTAMRFIDTIIHMKEGMYAAEVEEREALDQLTSAKPSSKHADSRRHELKREKLLVEEAWTPKVSEQAEAELSLQSLYAKDKNGMLGELQKTISDVGYLPETFPEKEAFVFNEGFDYRGRNSQFVNKGAMSNFSKVNYVVQEAHVAFIRMLLQDPHTNVYVVVSNGQSVNKLFKYMNMQGKHFPTVHYNGGAILDLNPAVIPRNLQGSEFLPSSMFDAKIVVQGERLIPGTGVVIDKKKMKQDTHPGKLTDDNSYRRAQRGRGPRTQNQGYGGNYGRRDPFDDDYNHDY